MKEIRVVRERRFNGITYGWYVSYGPMVSDGADYAVYENGKTVVKEFPFEKLPKKVQKFIKDNEQTSSALNGYEDERGDFWETIMYRDAELERKRAIARQEGMKEIEKLKRRGKQ